MKLSLMTLLALFSLMFLGCNANTSKGLNTDAHQQATNTTPKFPSVKRPSRDANCRNCYATFKLSMATQKQAHGHTYTECPVCKHDYLKKAK
jgi:hypothetical protein